MNICSIVGASSTRTAFCLATLLLAPAACGGNDSSSAGDGQSEVAAERIAINGRTFLRRDLWTDAEIAQLLEAGRPDQPGTTPEVLAAQLRAHTVRGGVYYIELEPNLALAEKILSGVIPDGTPGQPPREARGVFGNDDRTRINPATSYPASTMGFNESRGTGNRIGRGTIYTAAHVVYNRTDPAQPAGWYCFNGTTNTTGNCALPRWRFGVSDTTGATAWTTYACYAEVVPTAWLGITASTNSYDATRWDYAVVDMTSCNLANSGWIGTWILNDATIATTTVQNYGYAERVPCPSGSTGSATDCASGTFQLTGGQEPFTGARLWKFTNGRVTAGAQDSAFTIQSTSIDETHGDSGSAVIFGLNSPTDYRAIGIDNVVTAKVNIGQRWTSETFNFFSAYSHFPNDTN